MKYYEIDIKVALKSKLHFQKAPEAISKLISTALIKQGYDEHNKPIPKQYVFSNLGKAESGFFDKGNIIFRSFKEELVKKVFDSLFLYEDNIFKVSDFSFKTEYYKPIKAIISMNPVFVKLKDGNFWTVEKSGNLTDLIEALQRNLIRKYEMIFKEKLNVSGDFIEFLEIKNKKPMTYSYKGFKFFGNKFYIVPKNDEISQKLAFVALGSGLGHLNSTVGGGFSKRLIF
jgi:CRISPR-associated endoribonuclease Cas6